MSFSTVHDALTALTSCQTDVGTAMDMMTDVALDQLEAHESGAISGMAAIQDMMLDFARVDRELGCFVDVVQRLTAEASHQPPDALFSLAQRVEQSFVEQKGSISDAELHNHPKMVTFRESVILPQEDGEAENMEEDEDIVVAPSQFNFTCPLTQMEMENPMRNKVCNHHYDEAAILAIIKARHKQKKKCCCPVVGCMNKTVTEADLVPDHLLKRKIQRHNSQKV